MKDLKLAIRSIGRTKYENSPVTQRGRGLGLTGAGHYARSYDKRQSGQTISAAGIVVQGSGSQVIRSCIRFIGVDLGGGRGKTTAVAELRAVPDGVEVVEVATRASSQPWTDETLVHRLSQDPGPEGTVI